MAGRVAEVREGLLTVLVDRRLGNAPKLYVGRPGRELVALPEVLQKCAVFLLCKDVDEYVAEGTAFLVAEQTPGERNLQNLYLVTAKHLVDNIPLIGMESNIYFRLNQKDGAPYEPIRTTRKDWFTHPTDAALDIAVLPLDLKQSSVPRGADIQALPLDMALSPELIESEQIGVGDEVFTAGLFVKHPGRTRDIPIMRSGNIAMMPEEVIFKDGPMDVFFVESRSTGGLSGSPVFVRAQFGTRRFAMHSQLYWLGVHQGSWSSALNYDGAAIREEPKGVHMGIGIVVPAWKVLEVIYQPEVAYFMIQRAKEYRRREMPTPD